MAAVVPSTTVKTVETRFQELRQEVDQFVKDEMPNIKDYRSSLIETANEIGLTVDQTRNYCDFKDELSKTEEKSSEFVQGYLKSLETFLKGLKEKKEIELPNLAARAKQFRDSLPFDRSWQPKLLGTSPKYVYITNRAFEIAFTGTFRDQKSKLTIEGAQTSQVEATETSLKFRVTELPELPEAEQKRALQYCHFIRAYFEVEYNAATGMTSMVKTKMKKATYGVWIGAFPLSPGEISFGERIKKIEKQHTVSPEVTVSRQGATQKGEVGLGIQFSPTEGWTIVSKPKLVLDETVTELPIPEKNGIFYVNLQEGQDQVKAHVEFDEERETHEANEGLQKIWLKWGESHQFTSSALNVELVSFDKQKQQLTGSDETRPFLKVKNVGENTYLLIAEAPKQEEKK